MRGAAEHLPAVGRVAPVEGPHRGFRGSPQYQEWRQLLHHFSDPLPTVEHFAQVAPSEPLRVPVQDPSPEHI
jgi:hypothetical protein